MEMLNSIKNKNKHIFKPDQNLKLMDHVRQVLRYHHCGLRQG